MWRMQEAKPGEPGCNPEFTQARYAVSRRLGCVSLTAPAKLIDAKSGKSADVAA